MIGVSTSSKVTMSGPGSCMIHIVVIVRLPDLGNVGQDWLLVIFFLIELSFSVVVSTSPRLWQYV